MKAVQALRMRPSTGLAARVVAAASLAAAAALALLVGCSTAPKATAAVSTERNRATGLAKQGDSRFRSGNYADALSFYRQALEINIAIDDDAGVVMSRNAIGKTYATSGQTEDARGQYAEALELAERLDHPDLTAQCLFHQAELDIDSGDAASARAKLERAAALAPAGSATAALVLHARARAHRLAGELEAAETALIQAASINKKLMLMGEYASNMYLLSSVRSRMGDQDKALEYALAALAADKEIENSLGITSDYYALGRIALARGRDEDAYFYLRKSLNVALVKDMAGEALRALKDLIPLAVKLGYQDKAKDYEAMEERIRSLGEASGK